MTNTLFTGVDLIAAERNRQAASEEWSPEHDDGHRREQMALAAAVYAIPPRLRDATILRLFWPWERHWLKPTDELGAAESATIFESKKWREGRIKTLVKAGALIAAEIDRLQRRNSEAE